jgi:hypothetical protein
MCKPMVWLTLELVSTQHNCAAVLALSNVNNNNVYAFWLMMSFRVALFVACLWVLHMSLRCWLQKGLASQSRLARTAAD